MELDYTTIGVGIAGIIIILGVLLMKKADTTKISGVIPLLLLGMLIGPVTGLFDSSKYISLINTVVTFILVIVLFDVGYDISWKELKKSGLPALGLCTLAVILTAGLTWIIAYFLLNLSWELSLLFSALTASTDLTIVAPLINSIKKIKPRAREILSLESALNSVYAAIIAIIALNIISLQKFTASAALKTFLYNFFVGASLGLVLGIIIIFAIKKIKLAEKPHIISIGAVLLAYAVTNLVGASGITAALVIGIIFRNSGQNLPKIIKTYSGDLEILLIVFVYVILGTLFTFSIFSNLTLLIISVLLIIALLFARWFSAYLFTLKNKDVSRNLVFLSGPRGIMTAVLVLSYSRLFGSLNVLGIMFLVILITTLVSALLPFISDKPKLEAT